MLTHCSAPPPSCSPLLQPKEQTAKQLEGLLVKALKAAAPAGEERAQLRHAVQGLSLALPAARAALGAAA